MAEHGNSNKNSKPHHLYEIRDSEDDDIFKYGISHYPIGEDGYSNGSVMLNAVKHLAEGKIRVSTLGQIPPCGRNDIRYEFSITTFYKPRIAA